jgi:hypothetical protein
MSKSRIRGSDRVVLQNATSGTLWALLRFRGLNEAACGDGRYASARSNVFPSQPNSGSIGPVMIAKRLFANLVFIQSKELRLTQGVRLLSP